ncbi:MAG: Wzz/FepE/Etk N-terminal domain-containing protein [Candidatus Saganbacteria bacterium]|nr:Wzz/FepE/Etk N-terminal domain-containing protein [Candidatus Saganbacteria bacterium]
MDIRHLISMLQKRYVLFLAVFVSVLALGIIVSFVARPSYLATSKLIAMSGDLPVLSDTTVKLNIPRSSLIDSQIEMIKDNAVINEVIKELDIRNVTGDLVRSADLLSRLSVQQLEDTDIIQIKVRSQDPVEAANIANSAARQFVKWTQKIDRIQDEYTGRYIEESLKQIKYRQFLLSRKITDLKNKKLMYPVPEDLHEEILKQIELEVEKAKINMILKEEQLRLFITENNDIVNTLKNRIQFLDRGISGFASKISRLPTGEAAGVTTEKEEKVLNSLYAMFFQKGSELKVSQALKQGGARIISYAGAASSQQRPRKIFVFFAGLMLAFIVSAGTVFMAEYLDHCVKTGEEVRNILKVPLICEIPFKKPDGMRSAMSAAKKDAALKQEISRLADYLDRKFDVLKKTVIFSGVPADKGKAFAALNLAVSVSQSGRNVLVIDADSSYPCADTVFAVKSLPGLGEVMSGEKEIGPEVIRSIEKNLSVMTSGAPAKEEPGLFDQEKVRNILMRLKEDFDEVIIIGPCLKEKMALMNLFRFAEANVFVVSHGHALREQVREAFEIVSTAGAKTAGVVFSHVIFPKA